MILAAGQGTRLGSIGKRTAKALLEIDGEPLLARHLRRLSEQGVERVVVNASHLADQLEEFAAGRSGPPELRVVVERGGPRHRWRGAQRAAAVLGRADPGPLRGRDPVTRSSARWATLHEQESPVATLAVYHSDHAEDKGVVELSDSRVTAFHEKDPARTSGWVNAGIYIVEPRWLREFQPLGEALDFGFDLFPRALAEAGAAPGPPARRTRCSTSARPAISPGLAATITPPTADRPARRGAPRGARPRARAGSRPRTGGRRRRARAAESGSSRSRRTASARACGSPGGTARPAFASAARRCASPAAATRTGRPSAQ